MRTSSLIAFCSLAAALSAQTGTVPLPERGMLSSWQMGLVFDNAMDHIVRKAEGLPAKLESFAGLGRSRVPEFTVAAIRTWLLTQSARPLPTLEIDAMSTGNDQLPLRWVDGASPPTFKVYIPPPPPPPQTPTAWGALHLVVDQGEATNTRADIVGVYFDNPAFPGPLRNNIYTEILRSEFTAGAYPAPTSAGIAAMDWAMGVIETHGGAATIHAGISVFNKLYFSLTPASAQALDQSGHLGSPSGLTGGTIFEVTYNLANGVVTNVAVHRKPSQLGLDASDDIDALAMFTATGGSTVGALVPLQNLTLCYVLSCQHNQEAEELMVVGTPVGMTQRKGVFRTGFDERVVADPTDPGDALIRGRVRAACSEDPEVDAGAMSFGVPDEPMITSQPMGLSISARTHDPMGWGGMPIAPTGPGDSFRITGVVSGFGLHPGASLPYLLIEHDNVQTGYWLPVRNATDTTYQFVFDVNYPWHYSGSNRYRIAIGTVQLAPPHDLDATHWLELKRNQ